jgi:hypothetical protein
MTLYVATMPVYPGLLSVYIHNSFSCEFYWHHSKSAEYFFKFQCCVLGLFPKCTH